MRPKVRLISIQHGSEPETAHIISARLVDMNGETVIRGTIEYILAAIKERGYVLVGDKND